MAKIDVICPRCSEADGVQCNGHSVSGAQRYICKLCLKTFQLHFRYRGAQPDTQGYRRYGNEWFWMQGYCTGIGN